MGAIISREQRPTVARKRYGDLAEDALRSARAYREDIGGRIIRGAIMAYIDEDIDEARLARDCTLLEVCSLFLSKQRYFITDHHRHRRTNSHVLLPGSTMSLWRTIHS